MSTLQKKQSDIKDQIMAPAGNLPISQARRNIPALLKILLSSLFIQTSFNYRGMQNLGFAFAVLPLARTLKGDAGRTSAFLTRHLQLFNTHPYLSASIIGSVVRMEEAGIDTGKDHAAADAVNLKNALMGPYAALGDAFFWGALKPFGAVFGAFIGFQQSLLATVAFLFLFNPAHLWLRIKGFFEGYRHGREGINFIRLLELPLMTGRIRWLTLTGLGCTAVLIDRFIPVPDLGFALGLFTKCVLLFLILLCYWGIKKGISQVKMFYWMFIISCVLSI